MHHSSIAAFLKSSKAKAAVKKTLQAGTTKAKSATTPSSKSKAVAKSISKTEAANAKWERPNLIAMCRMLVDGDLVAAILLFHILYVWRNRQHKFDRFNMEWIGHTREGWASGAGLTVDELTKRALPRLKKHCQAFLTFRVFGRGAHKKSFVHVDWDGLWVTVKSAKGCDHDMLEAAWNGVGPGNHKKPANAYSKNV
jgi:hypothetical protein